MESNPSISPETEPHNKKVIERVRQIFRGPARALGLAGAVIAVLLFLVSTVGSRFVEEVAQGDVVTTRASSTIITLDTLAPKFYLPNAKGEIVSIESYRGSPVVLLYFASWNSASIDELGVLSRTAFPPGVVVLAVDTQEDPAFSMRQIERGKYAVNVLYDESGSVGETYGAKNLPALYFLNRDGVVKSIAVGVISSEEVMSRVERIIE